MTAPYVREIVSETWSRSGTLLTLTLLLADGRKATATFQWSTPEQAQQHAPATRRSLIESINTHHPQGRHSIHLRRGRRFNMVTGVSPRWRWLPQIALRPQVRFEWGRWRLAIRSQHAPTGTGQGVEQ
ncbi:hypothetical protein GCG21_08620 [Pseudactinotalea sp. HY160]|uniref:hypothetical protein n=1 Tax=Pseudactinotalea sp. HY160 TaxID=2654490 RepID=UPI00128B6803|nr:hypothetical protein [Pseudactinotalea sp. HY160]MPV50067.1 hypothetical protein [Pseudactinotalea sp. HY160]